MIDLERCVICEFLVLLMYQSLLWIQACYHDVNLFFLQEGELHIHNSDGQQQATILREDLPGFIFESNRNTKHSFTAETSLGPEFHAGWTGRRGKRFRSKVEAMKQKVFLMCCFISC